MVVQVLFIKDNSSSWLCEDLNHEGALSLSFHDNFMTISNRIITLTALNPNVWNQTITETDEEDGTVSTYAYKITILFIPNQN